VWSSSSSSSIRRRRMRPARCYTDQAELHITGRSAVTAIPSLNNESGTVRCRVVVPDAEIVSDHRHSASRSTVQPCAVSPPGWDMGRVGRLSSRLQHSVIESLYDWQWKIRLLYRSRIRTTVCIIFLTLLTCYSVMYIVCTLRYSRFQ
jgi:hypothetical protein